MRYVTTILQILANTDSQCVLVQPAAKSSFQIFNLTYIQKLLLHYIIYYIHIYIYLRFAVLFYLSPFFFFFFGFLRFLSLLVFFVRINVNRDILQRQVHIFRRGSISFTFRHVATDVTELKFKNYVSRIRCIFVSEYDADVRRVIRYDKFVFIIANSHQSASECIVRHVQLLNNDESTRRSLARRDGSSRPYRIFEANDTYSKQKTNINVDFLFTDSVLYWMFQKNWTRVCVQVSCATEQEYRNVSLHIFLGHTIRVGLFVDTYISFIFVVIYYHFIWDSIFFLFVELKSF